MTTDLCTEDVVVCISSPQMVTSEAGGEREASAGAAPAAVGAAGAVGGAPRVQASSAAVELGRRLLLAARAGLTAQVMDLMAKGAPFTTDWLGTSPLHVAAGNAHVATCAVLLRAGVSRDSRTKVDRTPLHLAAYGGHARVVQLLLEHGAAVDVRDLLRMTPLHWAAQRGHAAAAAALLRRGADPAALSKFNKTPRDLAADGAVRALIDDALRQRAAQPPPPPPPPPPDAERLTGQQETTEQQTPPAFRTIHRIQEIKNKPKQQGKFTKINAKVGAGGGTGPTGGEEGEEEVEEEEAGAQLLRRHGITLLPADTGSTVLSALQAGRAVVLSDAGKLMLKENVSPPPSATPPAGVATSSGAVTPPVGTTSTTAGVATPPAGVVLTATPVSSPPKPGVKIFTINNKLLTVPKDAQRLPVKKILNPQDMQVKFVQLPADAKILSPKKSVQMKAKTKLTPRPPVKIIMNKANYSRLIASAKTNVSGAIHTSGVHMVSEGAEAAADDEREVLRAELRAARLTIASLSAELAACRARLAITQPAPQ